MAKKPEEIPEHEQVILEPELEEALKNATDAEMCDIAGSDLLRSPAAPLSFPDFHTAGITLRLQSLSGLLSDY